MAYLVLGCFAGLLMAGATLASGGGLLFAFLAYSLGGAAATILLALLSVAVQARPALAWRQVEDGRKRLA